MQSFKTMIMRTKKTNRINFFAVADTASKVLLATSLLYSQTFEPVATRLKMRGQRACFTVHLFACFFPVQWASFKSYFDIHAKAHKISN